MQYDLGLFDQEYGRVECAKNSFGAKLLPMIPEWTRRSPPPAPTAAVGVPRFVYYERAASQRFQRLGLSESFQDRELSYVLRLTALST
jgi:hypothetical protein